MLKNVTVEKKKRKKERQKITGGFKALQTFSDRSSDALGIRGLFSLLFFFYFFIRSQETDWLMNKLRLS